MMKIHTLEDIIQYVANQPNKDALLHAKKQYAKLTKNALPTNMQILQIYREGIGAGIYDADERLQSLFSKRKVRSQSGIVPIQVLTKHFRCPGKCIFCPNDETMPKSYINTEPGAMRALLNNFDARKQVWNRLLSLDITGHKTDKIEMIVLGGTWDVYPDSYKSNFLRELFDACNTFDSFKKLVNIDYTSNNYTKFRMPENLPPVQSGSIEDAHYINETATHRIIGLTVETRPEYVSHKTCRQRRQRGITRLEIGIQSLFDDVLDANKRGHSVQDIRNALHLVRSYGFKFSCHFMPGLYKSTTSKDIETFYRAFSDIYIKPDEIKFYPTAVIPNTPLYELYRAGDYTPITEEETIHIMRVVKTDIIPPYTRIKRLIRDIPATEVAAGHHVTNLRQLVMTQLTKEYKKDKTKKEILKKRLRENLTTYKSITDLINHDNNYSVQENTVHTFVINPTKNKVECGDFVCLCTRCREIQYQKNSLDIHPILVLRKYLSSVGVERFISMESPQGYLFGLLRLLLPSEKNTINFLGLGKKTSLIRELHVYGSLASLSTVKGEDAVQHQGIGKNLLQYAEKIALSKNYVRISVISGIGVKGYYRKLGYKAEGTYMVKKLS